jgi:hypothetical protein
MIEEKRERLASQLQNMEKQTDENNRIVKVDNFKK